MQFDTYFWSYYTLWSHLRTYFDQKSCRIISKVNFPGLKSLGTKVAQSLGLQEKNKK